MNAITAVLAVVILIVLFIVRRNTENGNGEIDAKIKHLLDTLPQRMASAQIAANHSASNKYIKKLRHAHKNYQDVRHALVHARADISRRIMLARLESASIEVEAVLKELSPPEDAGTH